jgi:hypothetical protein
MDWLLIFEQSKVNGGMYFGDMLPPQNWKWPKNTWFQGRLRDLRRGEQRWLTEEKMDQGIFGMAFQDG